MFYRLSKKAASRGKPFPLVTRPLIVPLAPPARIDGDIGEAGLLHLGGGGGGTNAGHAVDDDLLIWLFIILLITKLSKSVLKMNESLSIDLKFY